MKNALAWGLGLGAATLGGIVYWSKEHLKLKNGDAALVPPAKLQLMTGAGVAPVRLESLVALGGLVRVDNVTRTGAFATGTAGRELSLSVPVQFSVADAVTLDRLGQPFPNPEFKA